VTYYSRNRGVQLCLVAGSIGCTPARRIRISWAHSVCKHYNVIAFAFRRRYIATRVTLFGGDGNVEWRNSSIPYNNVAPNATTNSLSSWPLYETFTVWISVIFVTRCVTNIDDIKILIHMHRKNYYYYFLSNIWNRKNFNWIEFRTNVLKKNVYIRLYMYKPSIFVYTCEQTF